MPRGVECDYKGSIGGIVPSNVVNYCGARFKNELGRSRPSVSRTS
jgi:hypothetical protein